MNVEHGLATTAAAAHEPHEVAAEHGHQHTGFVHVFRERAISLRSMDRPLRLITGLAIAQLVVAAVLITIRDRQIAGIFGYVQVDTVESHPVQMSLLVFLVSVVFLVVAWSYLLSGMLHAHPLARLAGLGLFSAAMYPVYEAVTGLSRISWLLPALLAAIWAVGAVAWLRDRRATAARSHRHHLRLPTFVLLLILVASFYAAAWWEGRGANGLLFPRAVSLQLQSLQFFLIPVLFLAGIDFAEWGEVTGERVAKVAARTQPPFLLAGLAALIASAILADVVWQMRDKTLLQLALGAVAAGLLLALGRIVHAIRGLPLHVPYRALVGAAGAYIAIVGGGAVLVTLIQTVPAPHQALSGITFARYRHTHAPYFSIAYPAIFPVEPLLDQGPGGAVVIFFDGTKVHTVGQFFVSEVTRRALKDNRTARQDWFKVFYGRFGYSVHFAPAPADGPWEVTRVTLQPGHGAGVPYTGLLWQRREGERLWLLYGETPPRFFARYSALYTAMVASWSPTLAPVSGAQAPPVSDARARRVAPEGAASATGASTGIIAGTAGFWVLVVVAGGVVLVARGRRGQGGARSAGTLFLVVVGLLFVMQNLSNLAGIVGLSPGAIPSLRLSGVQLTVAVVTLLVLAWLAVTRRLARHARILGLLVVLNVALQIVAWTYDLYAGAMDIGARFTIAQAVVILLALLWDVTMSGEMITNVPGEIFPRHARVLLFFGYVMLVATAVLYFSSFQVSATSAAVEPQFESEIWPQYGVVGLGMPLLLTLFVLKLVRLPERLEPGAAAAAPPQPGTGVGPHEAAAHAPDAGIVT